MSSPTPDPETLHATPVESAAVDARIHLAHGQMRSASSKPRFNPPFNPSVCDTFSKLKDVSAVLVPWRVFHKRPDCLHSAFRYHHGQIVYSDEVNVLMEAPMLNPSSLGRLDDFTQTWEVKVKSEEELDVLLIRLASFPSILSATLTKRKLLGDNSEIPTVLFLDPGSECLQQLARNLGECRKTFREGKHFSVEVDLGPSVEVWSRMVLRRDFLCIGARFCVTSGSKFNHMWDWTNILGCLPCLLCGLVAASVYRTNRKLKYIDKSASEQENIAIVGTKTKNAASQRFAIYSLMKWIHSVPSPVCDDCNHSLSKSISDVKCSEYHAEFQEQQRSDAESTLFAQSNSNTNQGNDDTQQEFRSNEDGDADQILSESSTADVNDVIGGDKNKQNQTIEAGENERKAKNRRTFLFPYYEEIDKYYEKDKNDPIAVRDKRNFIKSKKIPPKRTLGGPNEKNILLRTLIQGPYNEEGELKSTKRLDEEQLQELQQSITKNELELKKRMPLVNPNAGKTFRREFDQTKSATNQEATETSPNNPAGNKYVGDTSRHGKDAVKDGPESESEDENVPMPHRQTEDAYTGENETKNKNRRTLLYPYYEGTANDNETNRNDPMAVGDKRNFTKSKKTLPKRIIEDPNEKNILLRALIDGPYNEEGEFQSLKRMDEEHQEPNNPTGNKHFIDMSRYGEDGVQATSINLVYEGLESDEDDVPIPHGQTEDAYAGEFTIQQRSANGHAFILPKNPSDEFFDEYDPLSHGDVLNFLACKTTKKMDPASQKTKTPTKEKKNRNRKRSTRKNVVNKRESHA